MATTMKRDREEEQELRKYLRERKKQEGTRNKKKLKKRK